MKNKILTFIIGVLVGAIIATTGFLIYSKVNTSKTPQMMQSNGQMEGGAPGGNMGEPPEKPSDDGNNTSFSPAKPSENDSGNSDKEEKTQESNNETNS